MKEEDTIFLNIIKEYAYNFLLEEKGLMDVDDSLDEEEEEENLEDPETSLTFNEISLEGMDLSFYEYLEDNKLEIVYEFFNEILTQSHLKRVDFDIDLDEEDESLFRIEIREIDVPDKEEEEERIKKYYKSVTTHLTPSELFVLNSAIMKRDREEADEIMNRYYERVGRTVLIADEETIISNYKLNASVKDLKSILKINNDLKEIMEDIKREKSESNFFQVV